jgi:hypothetical protein
MRTGTNILALDLPDVSGLNNYSPHPIHQKFVNECIKPHILENGVCIESSFISAK